MVAKIDVVTNNITDVPLSGQPTVVAENLVGLRRHDPDDPTKGLMLFLVLLDPVSAVNIHAGELEADIVVRSGGRPKSTSGIVLAAGGSTTETTVGRLLNSQSQSEFAGAGNASAFTGTVETLPSGLSLNTRVNTGLATAIRLNSQAQTWEHWGGLYGQDFSDAIGVDLFWTSA